MNERIVTENPVERQAGAKTEPGTGTETVPLTEVLRQIRRDSRKEPTRYLNETAIPFDGE